MRPQTFDGIPVSDEIVPIGPTEEVPMRTPRLKVSQMDEKDERRLAALYAEQPLMADHLAYTWELNEIVQRFNLRRKVPFTHHQVYHHLVRMRKRGVLPVKGRR